MANTADCVPTPEGQVENYPDLEESETDLTGSGLKDTVLGSKELGDDNPEGKTSSKKPKGTPNATPITT